MKTHLTAAEIAALALPGLPVTGQAVRRRATREGWPYEQTFFGPRLYVASGLPARAQAALAEHQESREAAPCNGGV